MVRTANGSYSAATVDRTAAPLESRMNTPIRTALVLSLMAVSAFAQAQSAAPLVRSERNVSLELANQIAAATVAACSANGHAVTATVVDRAGNVRAVQRAEAEV
jgi:hypothetical protein